MSGTTVSADESPKRGGTGEGATRRRTWTWAAVLFALSALLLVVRVQVGTAAAWDLSATNALRVIGATFGVAEPLEGAAQVIGRARLIDGFTALLVGAALGLSGALLQGLFRNQLASPGLIGVTSGASLGAVVGILIAGGELLTRTQDDGGDVMAAAAENAPILITFCAFLGAMAVALFVAALASRGGRVSVSTLLLVGVAINACLGGVLAAVQDILLREKWQFAQAVFSWLFGKLDERTLPQVGIVGAGVVLALAIVPFVARELDLFGGGEDTAESLGVSTLRTKMLTLAAASVAAASAVAVAGQIAFVGLVVPHVVRMAVGPRHGALLPMSALGGAVFLCGAEAINVAWLGPRALSPGIVLSLVGGPFFLLLLLRRRREVATW